MRLAEENTKNIQRVLDVLQSQFGYQVEKQPNGYFLGNTYFDVEEIDSILAGSNKRARATLDIDQACAIVRMGLDQWEKENFLSPPLGSQIIDLQLPK